MRCLIVSLIGAFSLAGCASHLPKPEPEVHYQTVPVPVPVGCVVKRPDLVVPLNKTMTPSQWQARAPGAKAATIEAQAGRRLNFEDQLRAATSACLDAPQPGNK